MLRNRSLLICLWSALILCGVGRAATADRPNILFIYTDDHSYRTVSAYPEAYSWVRTPTIDGLAKQGVRFTSAYIGTWCMPSRATLLTGHHQFGVESMRMEGPYPGCVYDPQEVRHSGPRYFAPMATSRRRSASGTPARTRGTAAIGIFRLVWNRPKYTETSTHYYYDQPITYHGGKTEILKRYSTDQYTDWAVDLIKGKDRDPKKALVPVAVLRRRAWTATLRPTAT